MVGGSSWMVSSRVGGGAPACVSSPCPRPSSRATASSARGRRAAGAPSGARSARRPRRAASRRPRARAGSRRRGRCLAPEREAARHQVVEDAAERVDVGALRHGVAGRLLGRPVLGAAHAHAGRGQRGRTWPAGAPGRSRRRPRARPRRTGRRDGFRSRWMTPCECACASASAIGFASARTRSTAAGRRPAAR